MNLLASLRYLVALDEHRHFGRAAQACHITQPALSNAMRALEQEFGVVIVKRAQQYGGLTPEGERVLATAQRMLHEHHLLQQELGSGVHTPRGPLRLGAVPTAFPVLARFAARLQARHPGIVPSVASLSSSALESGLENLALDLALGYTGRMALHGTQLRAWPQYVEHYFLLRRAEAARARSRKLQVGAPMRWADAAALPLAMLTPDMHNRSIVDGAFAQAGTPVQPALETNSILGLTLGVIGGRLCSVLPGALVSEVRHQPGLEARPLVEPEVHTPIGFMARGGTRPSRALEAALELVQDGAWLREADSGWDAALLGPPPA